jgi:GT2 family glycosyltransferase|tara:strand:- start:256 stop:1050 length:795 start_codon:yes stop_codon:yes gene_type:complete
MSTELTIVIPTWNNPEMLKRCLESLCFNTKYSFNIVLVDNGGDGVVKRTIKSESKGLISVIEPNENLGWMRAHNKALESCDTQYYCMLNDDVLFIPGQQDFWGRLIRHLEQGAGAVGPSSNFVSGCQNIHLTNIPDVCDTTLLIGFCMVLKTEVLKDVGGLDADLPGGDDFDLSIRLRKAGYPLRIDRRAYLHHIGQQTGTRLFGEGWDSDWSQEVTNNAIIEKHGALNWEKCLRAYWTYPEGGEEESLVGSENGTTLLEEVLV